MNNIINFRFGTLDKYNAIAQKDNDTLYFADGQIFKGDKVYSQKVVKVTTLPSTPSQGIIYVLDDFSAKIYTGTDYIDLAVAVTKAINDKFAEVTTTLEGYYTKEQIDGKISTINTAIDTAKQAAIDAAATDAQSKADKALNDAKAYADGLNGAMDTRVKTTETAITWSEIA